jgi:hypothetical protein
MRVLQVSETIPLDAGPPIIAVLVGVIFWKRHWL